MKKILRNKINRNNQQGMSTLVISIALLIMTTMAIVFSANIGVMERKVSSNDFRASQAQLAAQAGIDIALSDLSQFELNSPVAPYTINGTNITTIGDQAITYNDGTNAVNSGFYNITIDTTLPNFPDQITIVSEGKSNDKSASAKVTQQMIFASPLSGLASDSNSILQKAVLIVDGSASINADNIDNGLVPNNTKLKVWASGSVTNSGADETKATLIGNNDYVNPGNTNPPLNHIFLASLRDPKNGGSNTDQGVKHISIRNKCTSPCENPTDLTETATQKPQSKLHYLEGDVTLNGITIGSTTYPVVIIADLSSGGSLTLKNNTVINGLLLIKGNWNNTNNSTTINGAVIIENGNLSNANNVSINYSTDVYNNLDQVGIYTRIPGGWSDIN